MTDDDARAMLAALGGQVDARLDEIGHAYPDLSDAELVELIRMDTDMRCLALRIEQVEAAAERAGLGPYDVHACLWPHLAEGPPGPRGAVH